MFKKITEDEIRYWECFYSPIAMAECLIPNNFRAPHTWQDEDCECIRLYEYQFPMMDYSYMYADIPTLKPKENFRLKKGAGDIINVGARDIGKSFVMILNCFFTLIHGEADESMICASTYAFLQKICQPISNLASSHPFFDMFKKPGKKCARYTASGMEIDTVLGHVQYGRNEDINNPEPGSKFHGIHAKKIEVEEVSYATKIGTEKRIDSGSKEGHIERLNGIPDIRMGSVLGTLLLDTSKKNWICRLPQYVRPDWDEKTREEKAKEYGGEDSPNYKLNVEGELLQGASGRWDMERVQKMCLEKDKSVKFFEIGKSDFEDLDIYKQNQDTYKQLFFNVLKKKIVLENIPAPLKICASDIGTTGTPSEVCLFFGDDKKLKWRYNIPLVNLTTQQQALVFKWIYDQLDGCFISLDCTNSDGRSIADDLEILGVKKDLIIRPMFNSKINVDFLKDKDNKVQFDGKGEPLYKQENTLDWACVELDKIFYQGLIEIPYNEKFLTQFPAYFELLVGTSKKYGSSDKDHLVQSFQCMAICRFLNLKANMNNLMEKQEIYVGGF